MESFPPARTRALKPKREMWNMFGCPDINALFGRFGVVVGVINSIVSNKNANFDFFFAILTENIFSKSWSKWLNLIKFICKLFSIGMNVLDSDKEILFKMVMTCTIVQNKKSIRNWHFILISENRKSNIWNEKDNAGRWILLKLHAVS